MFRKLILINAIFAMMLILDQIVGADIIWGVTYNSWNGGNIFTFDTDSSIVNIKHSYNSSEVKCFGDIAIDPITGSVYVTYNDNEVVAGFNKLAMVNLGNWTLSPIYNFGFSVNSIEFINGDLYGINTNTSNLFKYKNNSINSIGNLGTLPGGDLTQSPLTSKVYYSGDSTLNSIEFGPPLSTTGKNINSNSIRRWAGLTFSGDGRILYAGSYRSSSLYTLDFDTSNSTYTAINYANLGSEIGNIAGLSNHIAPIPEPGTLLLLSIGLICLAGYITYRYKFIRKIA